MIEAATPAPFHTVKNLATLAPFKRVYGSANLFIFETDAARTKFTRGESIAYSEKSS